MRDNQKCLIDFEHVCGALAVGFWVAVAAMYYDETLPKFWEIVILNLIR